MDKKPAKSRGTEVFNVGALAVDGAEQTPVPKTTNQLGSVAIKHADEELIEPGETIETVVHRHWIGIVGIYAEIITGISVILIGTVLALMGSFGHLAKGTAGLLSVGALLLVAFLVVILLLSLYVYRSSRIIITDQSLVAVVQKALFVRKISRLSMSNVEDVTAEQRGILATLLNFGELTIQTAGQEDNFIFPFCPKANDVADKILAARQAYARRHDLD